MLPNKIKPIAIALLLAAGAFLSHTNATTLFADEKPARKQPKEDARQFNIKFEMVELRDGGEKALDALNMTTLDGQPARSANGGHLAIGDGEFIPLGLEINTTVRTEGGKIRLDARIQKSVRVGDGDDPVLVQTTSARVNRLVNDEEKVEVELASPDKNGHRARIRNTVEEFHRLDNIE